MAFSLKYNNVSAPDFLKVTGVDQYLLPEIEHYNSKITGSFGNIDGGVTFGSKVFKVSYKIVFDGTHDDSYYIDAMALWLIGDNNNVSKLQLDTSGEYYKARVSDATDFNDAVLYGEGSITFTASNPRRYAASETSVSLKAGSTTVNYSGLVPALPVITAVCPSGTVSIKVTNATTGESAIVSADNLQGTIVIDCNRKFVSIDGTKDMTLLSMGSDWITLVRGNNTIEVVVNGTALTSINMKFTVTK